MLILSCLPLFAAAQAKPVLPPNAEQYMPLLKQSITEIWPAMTPKSFFGAQIEQETCISLKSKGCWNPHTELKTSREYGFGFGQLTIAYNADGTERFNAWAETKAMNKQLNNWKWEDRYNAEMQMKSLIVKNSFNWARLKFPIADNTNKLAFMAVTYNAGLPITDVKLCGVTAGCDPTRWFNVEGGPKGVEAYSTKSKVKAQGYGKSFFEISREYPRNLLFVRRDKYIPYLDAP